ncbi:N-acetylmuramoyl-L-alanine amidase [Thalassotalea sp. 1_MG-2023]|uniref:N-acetylmuramoyl-L-alanine amidase n=1 Tax=Thalassotalea sp. 1_MG-2023 TaxID=3062680 RepID=UPI0026E11BD8|nr:N-acetylmuramoyl-L-alanine amidase [Thalassotalea sp. 1_MG-2023]MDO6425623.1 N-acetylmuramoyl-L-alanine amidase [Thalassotalea sp. 1_MG-2023]
MLQRSVAIVWFIASIFTLFYASESVAKNNIDSVRVWPAPENTRVVFDLSSTPDYSYFSLKNPQRLVIDFNDTRNIANLVNVLNNDKRIRKIRTSTPKNKHSTRLVLELSEAFKLDIFALPPAGQYGDRLVVDLFDQNRVVQQANPISQGNRDIVIAIVAGHGGEDPGSIGAKGTYEKHVTLNISKKLAALLNRQKGLSAVMVRTGDYYVNHNRKTVIARENKADLLVSIHADAFTSPQPHGASVLVQSSRRANSEFTRWIANRQKESELLGGAGDTIKKTKDHNLALTLADMKKEYTMASSYAFAEYVLRELGKITKLHKKRPEGLSLAVLKSSDIPSVLIETGFISNHAEEKRLRSTQHQQKLAQAIYTSIDNYFAANAPDGTYYASIGHRKHKIARGESLSVVAHKYNVSVKKLKSVNKLTSNVVRIGQTLKIPRAD